MQTNIDFRHYLQEELLSRCRKNPNYSLRSFAKSVGMNHGILSLVLRNKRSLTSQMIHKIGLALNLNEKELENYIVQLKPQTKAQKTKIKKINQLTVDMFNIISDWYHDAILELSRIKGFQATPEYISKKLGITVFEARTAIERLIRVGLVEVNEKGQWIETLGDNTTAVNVDTTNFALRNLQKQVLEKSIRALEDVPKVHRDHSCMTMAINSKDLQEAKEKIKKFRHELMSYMQKNTSKYDEVYQLAVSFYPLTQIQKNNLKESK